MSNKECPMVKLPWLMAFSSDPCFRFLVAVLTLTTKMDINSSLSYIMRVQFRWRGDELCHRIKLAILRHSAVPCSTFCGSKRPCHHLSIPYSVNGYRKQKPSLLLFSLHSDSLAYPVCIHLPALPDIVLGTKAFCSAAPPHAFIGVIIECACLPETSLHRHEHGSVLGI